MAERRSALAILSALKPQRATLRRELVRHAERRGGMSVGFPKTEVLDFHLARILDALDGCEASIEIAIDTMRMARGRLGCSCGDRECAACILKDALEVIDDG